MNNQYAIFVFTKDRSLLLEKTLKSINRIPIKKYVFDDSYYSDSQLKNQKIISKTPDTLYIGNQEFEDFLNYHCIDKKKHDSFLRNVGCKDWNLGYVRNFALLYAKYQNICQA